MPNLPRGSSSRERASAEVVAAVGVVNARLSRRWPN